MTARLVHVGMCPPEAGPRGRLEANDDGSD